MANVHWVLVDPSGAQIASGLTDDDGNLAVQVQGSDTHTLLFIPDTADDTSTAPQSSESSGELYDA